MKKFYIILLSTLLLLCGCSQTKYETLIEFTSDSNSEDCAEIISNRLSYMGYKNKTEVLDEKIIASLNSTDDIQTLKAILSMKGYFSISLSKEPIISSNVKSVIESILENPTPEESLLNTTITRNDIKKGKAIKAENSANNYIELTFTSRGKEKLSMISEVAIKGNYGIVISLDDKYYQAPVESKLETDTLMFDRFVNEIFTEETAKMYAAVISCDELPCDLK